MLFIVCDGVVELDPGEHDVQIEILFCGISTLTSTPFVVNILNSMLPRNNKGLINGR
jgi:hypothetical protein